MSVKIKKKTFLSAENYVGLRFEKTYSRQVLNRDAALNVFLACTNILFSCVV